MRPKFSLTLYFLHFSITKVWSFKVHLRVPLVYVIDPMVKVFKYYISCLWYNSSRIPELRKVFRLYVFLVGEVSVRGEKVSCHWVWSREMNVVRVWRSKSHPSFHLHSPSILSVLRRGPSYTRYSRFKLFRGNLSHSFTKSLG